MVSKKPKQLSSRWIAIILCLVAVASATAVALLWKPSGDKSINNFETCKAAGGAILESYPEQCLLNGTSYTNNAQSVTPTVDGYVGLTEQAALDRAKSQSKAARVVERDGEALSMTMDFMPGRANLYVKDGKVYKVQIEGEE